MTEAPNLFVIGAPKAGTTSVSSWLSAHPDVFWSRPKEPFFFAADFPGQRSHYGLNSFEAYLQLYADAEAQQAVYRGDGSTTYLYSEVAASSILSVEPRAQFVVAVRNPLELLPSYHRTQLVALNENRQGFANAWHGSLNGHGPSVRPLDPFVVDYPRIGGLGAAVEALLGRVPRSQVHFIVFDDLKRDPGHVWQDLAEALALDPGGVADLPLHNASTKRARVPALRRLAHRPPAPMARSVRRLRQWSRTTTMPGVSGLKAAMWTSARRPTVSAQVRREMAQYYADDVRLLGSLISRDLTHWISDPGTRLRSQAEGGTNAPDAETST